MRSLVLCSLAALGAPLAAQQFFPPPPDPAANPTTYDKVLLGMALFWEEQLSSTDTVACGTCHAFAQGGTDPRPMPGFHPGPDGRFGTADDGCGSSGVAARDAQGSLVPSPQGFGNQVTHRKALSVLNAGYPSQLFYDGRARSLESLVLGPPVNPVEMGHPGRTWPQIAAKIARSQPLRFAEQIPGRLQSFVFGRTYPDMFAVVFGTPEVTPERITFAIAAYIRTLVADATPFDRAVAGTQTLTVQQQRGLDLFRTPQGNAAACVSCHSDISPESHTVGPASILLPQYYGGTQVGSSTSFHNVGVRPIADDPGIGNGAFKTPLLRGVALHRRFGHNGRFGSLAEVIEFYDRGGDFHVQQAPGIQRRNLSASDKAALVAFLQTLTDPRLVAGTAPFDSPLLTGAARARPRPFGVATPGTAGQVPLLIAPEPTLLGRQRLPLSVANVQPGAPTFLMWDLSIIPDGVTVFGPRVYMGYANFVLQAHGAARTGPDGTGYQSMAFDVPANARLAGLQLYAQWLILDPAGPNGAATSQPVEFTLQ